MVGNKNKRRWQDNFDWTTKKKLLNCTFANKKYLYRTEQLGRIVLGSKLEIEINIKN